MRFLGLVKHARKEKLIQTFSQNKNGYRQFKGKYIRIKIKMEYIKMTKLLGVIMLSLLCSLSSLLETVTPTRLP